MKGIPVVKFDPSLPTLAADGVVTPGIHVVRLRRGKFAIVEGCVIIDDRFKTRREAESTLRKHLRKQ